jgi:hypothetical protein
MAQTIFKDVDIFLFDFHWDERPLFHPERLKPDFAFLSNPEAYDQKQKAGMPFPAGGLELSPVTPHARKRNRFWSRYGAGGISSSKGDWNYQTPFTIRPKVTVTLALPNATVRVRPLIYVTSLGWSTSLELAVSGSLAPDHLHALTTDLLNKKKIFTIAAEQQHSNSVMSHFGKLWQNSVYEDPGKGPQDTLLIPRHIVVSIARYEGEAKPYQHRVYAEKWMKAPERAQMHGILWGKPFAPQQVGEGDDQKYLYTQFGDSNNFALTYFEHGSLVFMQDEAAEKAPKKSRRESMRCLARNLSDFSRTVLSFDQVLKLPMNEPLKTLKDTLRQCLQLTGVAYTNQFCKTWYLKHNLLKQL